MDYDLELPRMIKEINQSEPKGSRGLAASAARKSKAKRVCLQLPDGLKMHATSIVTQIEKLLRSNEEGNQEALETEGEKAFVPAVQKSKTKAEIFIWAGSNFGGCDIPVHLEKLNFDLIVNFGHAVFKK